MLTFGPIVSVEVHTDTDAIELLAFDRDGDMVAAPGAIACLYTAAEGWCHCGKYIHAKLDFGC